LGTFKAAAQGRSHPDASQAAGPAEPMLPQWDAEFFSAPFLAIAEGNKYGPPRVVYDTLAECFSKKSFRSVFLIAG
jgi:hypothetical protein